MRGRDGEGSSTRTRGFKRASVHRRARSLGLAILGAGVGLALGAPGATASGSAQGPPAGPTSRPFTQCPAIGADTSCEYLIDVTSTEPAVLPKVFQDPTQHFYDAEGGTYKGDDVVVGVQNDTGKPLDRIHAGVAESADRLFAFDGDGVCWSGIAPRPSECPFSSLTYDGPNTNLVAESPDAGTVFFNAPLQPGQYTYFALEAAPSEGIVAGEVNDYVATELTNTETHETGDALRAPSPVRVTDKATIKGPSAAKATGTVEYLLYSDSNCEKLVENLGKKKVEAGVAEASEQSSITKLHGNATYYWVAQYSGDGGPNSPNSSACGSETMTFGTPPVRPKPSITTVLSGEGQRGTHITVRERAAVTDTAIITAPGGQRVTGRVSYAAYSSPTCTGSAVSGLGGGTTTGVGPSTNPVALPAGRYYFQAFYSGSGQLASAVTPCGEEVLTVLSSSSPRSGGGSPRPGNGQFNVVGHPHVDERNGRIQITLQLPAAGVVTATGVVKQGASLARAARVRAEGAKGKKCRRGSVRKQHRCRSTAPVLYGAAALTAPGAGTYTILITPANRVLTALRHGKKLFVTVSVTFLNRSGGAPVTRVQSVLAKIKKKARRRR